MSELFGEPIYSYTRAQAIEDGVLIDVTETARECGFRLPVAITRTVWMDCVEWQDAADFKPYQDESGRLWDVLWMAYLAARRNAGASRVTFEMVRVPLRGRGVRASKVKLAMAIGPDDNGGPALTIMQPEED